MHSAVQRVLSIAVSENKMTVEHLNFVWIPRTHTSTHTNAHSHTQSDAVYFCDLDIEEAKAKARAVVAIP